MSSESLNWLSLEMKTILQEYGLLHVLLTGQTNFFYFVRNIMLSTKFIKILDIIFLMYC